MAHCDLCGEQCKAGELQQLLTQYQAAGVVDVCPSCERWATGLKSGMLDEIPERMRSAISERKGKPKAPWWKLDRATFFVFENNHRRN
jgi:hypothetical protein